MQKLLWALVPLPTLPTSAIAGNRSPGQPITTGPNPKNPILLARRLH